MIAGVLLLALAVLLGFLLIPSDDSTPQGESSTTTTTPQVSTQTVTGRPSTVTAPPSTVTSTVPPTTTTTTPRTVGPQPTVPGTDQHGFVSGPRCNASADPVVMVGQTDRSKVVVCQVGSQTGRYYYKGLADGMTAEIGFPTRSGNQFVAMKDGYTYRISPTSLTITTGGDVVSDEPMIYYWTN
jgi:hypothetical protein